MFQMIKIHFVTVIESDKYSLTIFRQWIFNYSIQQDPRGFSPKAPKLLKKLKKNN